MWAWPDLVLTDYERKSVRIYKTKEYPGVLRRTYKLVLNNQAAVNVSKNLPLEKTTGQVQIARRSRVFALSFSGNIDFWRLGITNASGTQYTTKTPRPAPVGSPFAGQRLDPLVSSMVPSSTYNAESLGGNTPTPFSPVQFGAIGPDFGPIPIAMPIGQPTPLLLDPNWLLLPNETLIFNGTPYPFSLNDGQEQEVDLPLTLTIAIHVWEFPNMGRASKDAREAM